VFCHMSQYLINNNNNNNIEIIWDIQFKCLYDLNYDTWPNVNMPGDIIINLIRNNNIKLVGI
jgi:hypothetical protein